MSLFKYWKEKADITKDIFNGWQKNEESIVRTIVVSKVMEVPIEDISIYLKKHEWLREFTSDLQDVNISLADHLYEKAEKIIIKYFYHEDFIVLSKILNNKNVVDSCISRNQVCELIKDLVVKDKYEKLDKLQKEMVDTLEKVYFEPVELINYHIEEKAGSEVYYSMLIEQWKTANEMAAHISEQRNNMNNFYMSLMSVLIGGILFSDQLLSANNLAKTVLFIAVAVIGFICCNKWIAQICNYGKLNGAKYDVINELERHLAANVMLYEYKKTEKNTRKDKVKINFSAQEKSLANLFRVMVVVVPGIMIVGTWWDDLWKILQMVLKLK